MSEAITVDRWRATHIRSPRMSSSSTAADVAVLSTTVRTLDPDRPEADAVAFCDGVIVAVGSEAEVREVCDSSTELIDGSDMAVVPGIVDGHIHPFSTDHV